MIRLKKQAGFSVVEALIIFVVIGALVFVGYTVYKKQQADKQTNTSQSSSSQEATAHDVKSAPTITTADDLDTAQKTLDDASLDSDPDSTQLNKELSEF